MAHTDSPLKDLVESNIYDFAAWLLNVEIRSVQAINVEFTGQDARVDRLFEVLTGDGRPVILHFEFQGRSTNEPMRLRLLDYMSRIARSHPELAMHSVVFYIGNGVGAKDTGDHQINGIDGKPTLQWRYQVVHLWKIKAETLLALNRPALLGIIGQTQIDRPEIILPQVVEQIQSIPNPTLQSRVFADLVALLDDQEMIDMIKSMVKEEGLLMNTPFLREVRADTRRSDVLNAIAWRFDPPLSVYHQLEQTLQEIKQEDAFTELLKAVIQSADFADFQKILNRIVSQQPTMEPSA